DPISNSLLVKASPLDLLTIQRLVAETIDSGQTDSKAVIKTWIVGPLKYATASEVVTVICDVYREQMNNNPRGGDRAFGVGFGGARTTPTNLNIDANGNPRGVTLSVGIDDRTNSIVLACSEAMYQDVKRLIEQLETAAKDATRTIKVIDVKGIDPSVVQQAIEAIQGARSNFRSNTTGTGLNNQGTPFGTFSPYGQGQGFQGQGMNNFRGGQGIQNFP